MLEFTDWAIDILTRADAAARRFNPDARVRLASVGGTVQAVLTDAPADGDRAVEVGGATIYVQQGLEGLVDCVEPHDRIVLRPTGSPPNEHRPH